MAPTAFKATKHGHHNDNANPAAREMYEKLVHRGSSAELAAECLESEHFCFCAEEIFHKTGNKVG